MESPFFYLTACLFSLACLLSAVFLLGYFVLKFFKINNSPFSSLFFSLLIGTVLLVTIFSITITKFNTVNIGFILFGCLLWVVKNKHQKPFSISFPKRNYLIILVCFLLSIFAIDAFQYLQLSDFSFKVAHRDYCYYADLSESILLSGIENVSSYSQIIGLGSNGKTPYHYFEIWINSLLVFSTGLPAPSLLTLVTYPFLKMMALIGILAIWEQLKPLNLSSFFLSFLLLFVKGVIIKTPFDLFANIELFSINTFSFLGTKALPIYIFLLATTLLIIKEKYVTGIIVLCSTLLVSVAALPAVIGGSALFIVYHFFTKKDKSKVIKMGVTILLFTIYFYLFYFIFNTNNESINENKAIVFFSSQYFKTALNILGLTIIQMLVIYLVWLFLVGVTFKRFWEIGKERHAVFVLLLSTFSAALFGWAIANPLFDSVQLFSLTGPISLNILLVVIFINLFTKTKKNRVGKVMNYSIISLLLIICGLQIKSLVGNNQNQFSANYVTSIVNKIEKGKHLKGAFIVPVNEYKNTFHKNTLVFHPAYFTGYVKQLYTPFSINITEAWNQSDDVGKRMISKSPFYQFIEKQKNKGEYTSLSKSQLDFITTYKIDYVMVSKESDLPSTLLPLVSSPIIDEKSGQKFYFLNI